MDSSLQTSSNSNTQFITDEFSIHKVSADGEPHEVMTMIAAGSGLIAAIIVLAILVMLIGCGNAERSNEQQSTSSSPSMSSTLSAASSSPESSPTSTKENSSNTTESRVTIIPMYQNHKDTDGRYELVSVSTISNNNNNNNNESNNKHHRHHNHHHYNRGYDNFACSNDEHFQSRKDELILKAITLPEIKIH